VKLDGRAIYQVDPATYFDTDADGLGDLGGVLRRLDHIRALGADTLWLRPFYVSPYREGGYDVVDHCDVSARYGTMMDFERLVERCHHLDLRVIVELVVRHTSVDHPWFRAAREDVESPYRDYYHWAPEPPAHAVVQDLNVGHPAVRREISRVIRHWLDRGVDGFKLDAVPHVVRQAAQVDARDDGYWILTELAAAAGGAPLIGEVDGPPQAYFGQGDRLHAVLNSGLSDVLFRAIERGTAEPLVRALDEQPQPPDDCTYINYVRRRLAPMLEDDRRIGMAHAIVQSLPGVPVVRYGDEIGMGDDDRTPMQWSAEANAGFSTAPMVELAPIEHGPYAAARVNVADQELRPGSLLSRVAQLIHRRRELGALPPRRCETVGFEAGSVLGLLHHRDEGAVLMLVNLAGDEVRLSLPYTVEADLLADGSYEPAVKDPVHLSPYGYRWLRVA
jgi:maltose alpha-D-glucosyltransferase/alpha-amylase